MMEVLPLSQKIDRPIPTPPSQGITESVGTVFEQGNINVSAHPDNCRGCGRESGIFHSAGHPDDGMEYACGIMVEAMETDTPVFSCAHLSAKKSRYISHIIDAEEANAALVMVAELRGRAA